MTQSFAAIVRNQQLAWALNGGIPLDALELRNGQPSWILKTDQRTLNLYRPEWWSYIAHAEHRWSRALNSSQCFAVNLFSPLAEDPLRARRVLQILLPERSFGAADLASVRFEYAPEHAASWFGESEHTTQIDVYFEVTQLGRLIGQVLVEVKYLEDSFGCCRGWNGKRDRITINSDRSRCLNVLAITSSPHTNCWLSIEEGRRYWEVIGLPGSSFRLEAIQLSGACPFRHGLYQLMRNRVLADELARRYEPAWADFAVCRHPANESVVLLDEPVSELRNAIRAFRSISTEEALRDWNAQEIVEVISSTDEKLNDWKGWMVGRYFGKLSPPRPVMVSPSGRTEAPGDMQLRLPAKG